MAAVNLRDMFDNGQAKPCPTHLATPGLVDPVESLEQPRKMLGLDAATMIGNR